MRSTQFCVFLNHPSVAMMQVINPILWVPQPANHNPTVTMMQVIKAFLRVPQLANHSPTVAIMQVINPILWVPQPPNNYYDTSNQHNSMASSTTQQLLWCKWSTQFYGFLNQATVAMACWQPTLVNIIIASFTVIGHWLQHSNGGYASWKSGRSQPAQRLTQDTEDTLG